MQQFKKPTNALAVTLIALLYSCCYLCFFSCDVAIGSGGVGVVAAFTTLPRRDGLVGRHARSAAATIPTIQSSHNAQSSLGGIQDKRTSRGGRNVTSTTVLYMRRLSRPLCLVHSTLDKVQKLQSYSMTKLLLLLRQTFLLQKMIQKVKLTMAIFVTCFSLCLGPLHNNWSLLGHVHPPMAHASTVVAAGTNSITSSTSSAATARTVDKIVHEYVQRHMFQDDMYDPVESTYREIIHDASTQRQYSKTLTSILGSVLGKKTVAESTKRSGVTSSDGQAIKFLLKLVDAIQEKSGLSKSVIIPALFFVGGGIPVVMVLAGLMSFSYSQKAMTERMAIERYGESVLEAEELVVRDEDEDEEEDDEDEEDDDDEDEDDDDDDDEEEEIKDKKKR